MLVKEGKIYAKCSSGNFLDSPIYVVYTKIAVFILHILTQTTDKYVLVSLILVGLKLLS